MSRYARSVDKPVIATRPQRVAATSLAVLADGLAESADLDRHGDQAMRRHHLLDQMAQGQAGDDEIVLLAAAGELRQDVAAALGLRAQQQQILVVRIRRLGVAHQLLGHHRDGRQRRAEPMRGSRGKTIQRGGFGISGKSGSSGS